MSAGAKGLFLLDPDIAFLNHGSFGACPREVLGERRRIEEEAEREPVDFLARRSGLLLEAAQAELAGLLGSAPSDLAFLPNATAAVATAAASLRLAPGDEILASDHEYGACELALESAAARAGAAYRRFVVPLPWRGDADFLDRLESAIGPRTRVLFLSHVTSPTALRFPVEAAARLARDRGLVLVVDGAHAPGQLDLDLDSLDADWYAGNCHKWLCAPKGSAFLRVAPRLHGEVVPPWPSWGLVDELAGTERHAAYAGRDPLARRLRWLGTRDLSPFLATPAAIRFMARHDGPAARSASVRLAADAARRAAEALGLEPLGEGGEGLRMSLVPLPPCDADALGSELRLRHRVEVPVTSQGERRFLRLSFHIHTGEEDVEALLRALRAVFGSGRAPP